MSRDIARAPACTCSLPVTACVPAGAVTGDPPLHGPPGIRPALCLYRNCAPGILSTFMTALSTGGGSMPDDRGARPASRNKKCCGASFLATNDAAQCHGRNLPATVLDAMSAVFEPSRATVNRMSHRMVAAGGGFAARNLVLLLRRHVQRMAARQTAPRRRDPRRIRPAATAAWMPVFSQQLSWLALPVICSSLGCLPSCAAVLPRDRPALPAQRWRAWHSRALHAGWPCGLTPRIEAVAHLADYRRHSTQRTSLDARSD